MKKNKPLFSLLYSLSTAILLAGCATSTIPMLPQGNYQSIYRGNGLNHWSFIGSGFFSEENDTLRAEDGPGLLWFPAQRFGDFELVLEWKSNSPSADSGVFVRIANLPELPRHAIEHGYEIQIKDHAENPLLQTGAVRGYAPPSHVPVKETGHWNEMKIIARENEYNVWINQEHVCTFFSRKTMNGYIGLQNNDNLATVWFRNIRIREL